jgi:hypothetical protein
MGESSLSFIVMPGFILVRPLACAVGVLAAGSRHCPGRHWNAGQPGRTRQRLTPGQAPPDPRGSEIPAANAA